MLNALATPPPPQNEPVHDYAPGSPRRAALQKRLHVMRSETIEIPAFIGGEDVFTGDTDTLHPPHDHAHTLGRYHRCGKAEVDRAIEAARAARHDWARMPWTDRAAIFLKAAELLAGPWRDTLNAATMLGQSKNVFQAEIDSACELIDFFRFNVHYMSRSTAISPIRRAAPGTGSNTVRSKASSLP